MRVIKKRDGAFMKAKKMDNTDSFHESIKRIYFAVIKNKRKKKKLVRMKQRKMIQGN